MNPLGRLAVVMAMMPFCGLGLLAAEAGGAASAPSSIPATTTSQPFKKLSLDLGGNVSLKMVVIPAGKFMMGSPKNEKDRSDNEGPRHEVTLTRPFAIGVYLVTQEQWKAVMGTEPWKGRQNIKIGASQPASHVGWDDAAAFCKKFSQKTGKTVRLPTEAEWEYACRAGSSTRFYYGDDPDYSRLADYAWYRKNAWDAGESYSHAVGLKKPNDWGLYDMHGNLMEWCADWFADSYTDAAGVDPQGPASGKLRVLRGGYWGLAPACCRSAARLGVGGGEQSCNIGFRVTMDVK